MLDGLMSFELYLFVSAVEELVVVYFQQLVIVFDQLVVVGFEEGFSESGSDRTGEDDLIDLLVLKVAESLVDDGVQL